MGNPAAEVEEVRSPPAPPLPRRDSRRARRDGAQRTSHELPRHTTIQHSRSRSDERCMVLDQLAKDLRNGSTHGAIRSTIPEINPMPPDHPSRQPHTVSPFADPPRRHSYMGDRTPPESRVLHAKAPGSGSREYMPQISVVENGRLRRPAARPGRREMTPPRRSHDHVRAPAFPSIHEDYVYVDGTSPGEQAYYTPEEYEPASASHGSRSDRPWPHSRGISSERNPSSQWTSMSSGERWSNHRSERSTPIPQVRVKATTVPAALYQQALALKPLPPPPPPSKLPFETHPLLEQNMASDPLLKTDTTAIN